MNRRDLLRYLLSTPLAATLDVEKLLWIPKPIITVPARTAYSKIVCISNPAGPDWLQKYWMVPYHEIEAKSGQWIGQPRIGCYDEIAELIRLLEVDQSKKVTLFVTYRLVTHVRFWNTF